MTRRDSGVYEIRNTVNGKRYVGSSQHVAARLSQHRRVLRKGQHHSLKLQRAFKKYGEDSFRFALIVVCAKRDLLFYENRALDFFECATKAGYNMNPRAGRPVTHSPAVTKRLADAMRGNHYARGYKHTEEQKAAKAREVRDRGPEWRAKIGATSRSRGISAETRAKMVATRRANGTHRHTGSARAKMSRSHTGKTLSASHRANIGIAARDAWRRRKEAPSHSPL